MFNLKVLRDQRPELVKIVLFKSCLKKCILNVSPVVYNLTEKNYFNGTEGNHGDRVMPENISLDDIDTEIEP